ncbi:conjugal transfer protein TraF [Ketobacter sp.]|uniref:conjugal transfer protein TraF n=1 Tax=Ketobacter sp. TaxID=2083498 RepID=UPI0025BB81D6|nr:conjugal transfer protein TraF [Ketobacter sp.]
MQLTPRTILLSSSLLAAALLPLSASAQPFMTLDARSMAMGDTGVASAQPGTASLFNPALLSSGPDSDHLHIVLPNLGLAAFADPDAIDAYQDIDDEAYLDQIDDAIVAMEDAVNDSQFLSAKQDFTSNSRALNDDLDALSNQPFRINGAAFASISAPGTNLGMALFVNANATLETSPRVSACDNQLLDDYLTFFESVNSQAELALAAADPVRNQAGCDDVPIVNLGDGSIHDPTDDLTSDVLVAGVTVTEVGVSLSKEVMIFGRDVSLGITPKLQSITSYYAVPNVQDLENEHYDLADELEASENTDDDFNLDLGLATTFLDDRVTLGLVVKNLIANQYRTKVSPNTGEAAEFDVETQARLGLAWDAPLGLTLAADLDLTRNQPYFLGEDTQFLGAGVEWDVASIVRLRGGVRTNLADNDDHVFTAGVGFNIIAVYVDLAAQFSENNAGGALQMGVQF